MSGHQNGQSTGDIQITDDMEIDIDDQNDQHAANPDAAREGRSKEMRKNIELMKMHGGDNETVHVDDLTTAPQWLRDGLCAVDADGNGDVDKSEFLWMLEKACELRSRRAKNEPVLDYRDAPDAVKEILKNWDADESGTVDVAELVLAARAQKKLEQENRLAKKIIGGLSLCIIVLALLNFVMGYLAVQAGKDFRPEESSESHRARKLAARDSAIGLYGEKRVLHATESEAPPGALTDADGIQIGTAPTKQTIVGLGIFDKLATIPPSDIGLIESLTIPTSSGPLVMGPFTDVSDTVSPVFGVERLFTTSGDLALRVHYPPYHPNAEMAVCGARPFLERVDIMADTAEHISEFDISSQGMAFCGSAMPPPIPDVCGGPPPGFANDNYEMTWNHTRKLSVRKGGYTQSLYARRKLSRKLAHDDMMDPRSAVPANYTPTEPCEPVQATMIIQGQPAVPDPVALVQVPDIHEYCGPDMMCAPEDMQNFFEQWSDPNHMYSDNEFDRYDANGDGIVDEEEMWNPGLPSFDKVQTLLQRADPDVQNAVRGAANAADRVNRRRLEGDLLSGNFRQRLRVLSDSNGRKLTRMLHEEIPFDAAGMTDLIIEQKRSKNPQFKGGISTAPLVNMLCDTTPETCEQMEAFVAQADASKSGYVSADGFDDLRDRAMKTADAMKQPDMEAPKSAAEKKCDFFKMPDSPAIYSPMELVSEDPDLFDRLNLDGDMMVTQDECLNFGGSKISAFDKMVEKCANKKEKRAAKCRSKGVRMRDCTAVLNEEFGDKNMARVVCALRDVDKPYANPKGGLMREEVEMDFREVIRLRFDDEDADMYGEPRQLQHLVGKKYRDPQTGLVKRSTSAFSKQHKVFHERVVQGLVNVPRMRRMEAKIVKRELKLRENMKRKLQAHTDHYEAWELERRLRSTERLRRRRVLLAFDPENHDPEETHRELRRVNRRLHAISEGGRNGHRELEKAGRRLAQESENHAEERKLRALLEDPTHLVSKNHKGYVEEFGIKRTSRQMRELMELTHASKRNLMSMAELGFRLRDYIEAGEVDDLNTFVEEASCMERRANGRFQRLRGAALRNCPGKNMPLPQKRVLKSFRKAEREPGGMMELGWRLAEYFESHSMDDATEEMREEQGDQQNANDFDMYNTDGDTMADAYMTGFGYMARRHRVLVEIGERRRMRALTELENGNGRKLMEESDEYHRRLYENTEAVMNLGETPILNGAEMTAMFDGDMDRATDMAQSCRRESDQLQRKMMIAERRTIRMLQLTDAERRELDHESLDGFSSETGTVSPPPDPLGADAMCTPCQAASYLSPAFYDTAMARPLNMQAYEMGVPNWCAEDLNNFEAVLADQPELLTAYGPMEPAAYYDTTDPNTGTVYPDPAALYPPADYMPDGPIEITQGPNAGMANNYYCATGYCLDEDPAAGMGSMVDPPMDPMYPGMDDMWPMGSGGSDEWGATYEPPADPSMGPNAERTDNLGAAMLPMPPRGRRMLTAKDMKQRKLSAKDVYPYMKQQHVRKLSVKTPAAQLVHARAKVRSLTEHTVGGGQGYEMFSHQKKAGSYRHGMRQQALQRRLQKNRRLQEGDATMPTSMYQYDGSGRRLHAWVDNDMCASPMPSQMMACAGIFETSATGIPNPDRDPGMNAQPRANSQPVTFAQFARRMMETNPPDACNRLPPEEREMPMDPVTLNIDLNPFSAATANLDTDRMGRGCIAACGCHFLAQMPDNTEAIVNTCSNEAEWSCPCMVDKRECHRAVRQAWDSRGGADPVNGGGRAGGAPVRRARKLTARQNVRQHRMKARNLRKLLKADVKKLKHDDDMKRQRRRSLMRRSLSEEHVSKLESFESKFHRGFGRRHRSIRILTGKAGDSRRSLKTVETFHKGVRRLRSRQLQVTDDWAYGPMGAYMNSAPGEAAPAMAGIDLWSPAPPLPAGAPEMNTGEGPWTPAVNSYAAARPDPRNIPDDMTAMPLQMMDPPAPEYDLGAAMLEGGNDGMITVNTIVNHNFYDGATNSFMDIAAMRVEDNAMAMGGDSPWAKRICYSLMNAETFVPDVEQCVDAMPYQPMEMGYTPAFFEDYTPGNMYCPSPDAVRRARKLSHDDPPLEGNTFDMMYGPEPSTIPNEPEMPAAMTDESNPGMWSPMMDLPYGTECLEGMPVSEEAYDEAMQFASGDNDRQIKEESTAAMKERARPPKAIVTEEICGRECPRPNDGSLERQMMDEAARRFDRPLTGRDATSYVMPGSSDPSEFAPRTEGQAMVADILNAFDRPGEFRPAEFAYDGTGDMLEEVLNKDCVSPGMMEALSMEKMARTSDEGDLGEVYTVAMPAGDMRSELAKSRDKLGDLFDMVVSSKRDRSDRDSVSLGDVERFAERCRNMPAMNPDACALMDPILEISRAAAMRPDPRREGVASDDYRFFREDLDELANHPAVNPGADATMPAGVDFMTMGDAMCREMMLGDKRCQTPDCAREAFMQQTRGAAKAAPREAAAPRDIVSAIETDRDGPRKPAEERRREERRVRDREAAERVKDSEQVSRDNRSGVEAVIEDIEQCAQRRVLRRALEMAHSEFSTIVGESHTRRALQEVASDIHHQSDANIVRRLRTGLGLPMRSAAFGEALLESARRLDGRGDYDLPLLENGSSRVPNAVTEADGSPLRTEDVTYTRGSDGASVTIPGRPIPRADFSEREPALDPAIAGLQRGSETRDQREPYAQASGGAGARGSCVGRAQINEAVRMVERSIRSIERQRDVVREEEAAPRTGRRPPAQRPEMERQTREVDARLEEMRREAEPLMELRNRYAVGGQEEQKTDRQADRSALETSAAANSGRRPLPGPQSRADAAATSDGDRETFMRKNRGSYREPTLDRDGGSNGDVMHDERMATAFTRTLEMAATATTIPALISRDDTINELDFERSCVRERGSRDRETEEACADEWRAVTKAAPRPPMTDRAPVLAADLMESSTPRRGTSDERMDDCPADMGEYQMPRTDNGGIVLGRGSRRALRETMKNTKSRLRKLRLQRRLASLESEDGMPEVVSYGSRRHNRVVLLDTPLNQVEEKSRRLASLSDMFSETRVGQPGESIAGRGSADDGTMNVNAGSRSTWRCADYRAIVEGVPGPGYGSADAAMDVVERATTGDQNVRRAQAENVRTTFTARRNERAPPRGASNPMASTAREERGSDRDGGSGGGMGMTAAFGASAANMASDMRNPFDYRRKLLQKRKHHQSPGRKLLAMQTHHLTTAQKQKFAKDNLHYIRRLAHSDMFGSTMAPGSDGAPPAGAPFIAWESTATTPNPAMDAMYNEAVMGMYGGAQPNPVTFPPAGATTLAPVPYVAPATAPPQMVGFDPALSYASDPMMHASTDAPLVQDSEAALGSDLATSYDTIVTSAPAVAAMGNSTFPNMDPMLYAEMEGTDEMANLMGDSMLSYDMYGNPVMVYAGEDPDYLMEYGDPNELMGTADQAMVDAATGMIETMMNADPEPDMDPQMMDGIASAMTAGHGEWDVVQEIEADLECDDLGMSDFATAPGGPTGADYASMPVYQIDYAAECRYKKDMQKKARKVENILLTLVRNKAHNRMIGNTRPTLRKMLERGTSVPTYVRKLVGLPQDWQIEDRQRRILKEEAAKPEDQRRKLQEADIYMMAVGSEADQLALGMGGGVGDSENGMYTPEQLEMVEPMEEVAQFTASECGAGMLDETFCEGMRDMFKAYKSYETEEYFKARADPRRLQTLIHIGLSYKDAKELLDTVRDMFMTPKPGDGAMGPDMNDPDECLNLWDQHLGCWDLAYMSTDYSDWENPKLDDATHAPHNRCKAFANNIRQNIAERTEDKPMQKALIEVLKQLGRWDSPSNEFNNAMMNDVYLTPEQVTNMCSAFYEGDNGWEDPSASRYSTWASGSYDYEYLANQPRKAKDILACPTQLAYGTTALPAEEGYYRCFEAKAQFQAECEELVGFINNQMTIPGGASGPFGNWRSAWDAEGVRSALAWELNPDHEESWYPFKKVGSKLAKCSLKAVREFIPETKVMDALRDLEEGKIKPATVFKQMVGPEIMKMEHVRDMDEALEVHSHMSDTCKEFCATHGMWQSTMDAQDPFTWVHNDIDEPMFEIGDGYAGAYPMEYDAVTLALTETITPPPAGECRVEVECELYEVLDAPDTRQAMHNHALQKNRRMMRRQRRLKIEERRRLEEQSPVDEKAGQQASCMTIDGEQYCKAGGDPIAKRRKLAADHRRNLHEYLEERGVSMIVPALSAVSWRRSDKPAKKAVSVRDVAKRRLLGV